MHQSRDFVEILTVASDDIQLEACYENKNTSEYGSSRDSNEWTKTITTAEHINTIHFWRHALNISECVSGHSYFSRSNEIIRNAIAVLILCILERAEYSIPFHTKSGIDVTQMQREWTASVDDERTTDWWSLELLN